MPRAGAGGYRATVPAFKEYSAHGTTELPASYSSRRRTCSAQELRGSCVLSHKHAGFREVTSSGNFLYLLTSLHRNWGHHMDFEKESDSRALMNFQLGHLFASNFLQICLFFPLETEQRKADFLKV